jgi:hypothetical protein
MKTHLLKHILSVLTASSVLLSNVVRADDTATNSTAATATTPETAPSKSPEATPWQLAVTVPLFAAGIDGNATLRGRQQDVNVSFNTLREHLDASFALAMDLSKGKFDLYSDASYMKFSGNFNGPLGGNTGMDLKFVLADAGAGYVLIQAGDEHPFVLAGTVGVRYWYADTGLTFKGSGGNVTLKGGNTYDVVDPVIGLRGSQYFTRKFHLDFSADGGGFDINNDTDWTWSATGVLTYDFVKWFSLSAGYKAVALDEAKGSGTDKKGVDFIFNGVLIAATFKF